jgi:NTE family protein
VERSNAGLGSNGTRSPKIGLALAGGGPEGAIYEIGALRALDEAVDGLDLNNLFIYVGVSAGAFIGANLANNLTTAQMCRAIVSHEPGEHPFVPETFFTPAFGEVVRGSAAVPKLFFEGLRDWVFHRRDLTLIESMLRLSWALPVGVFDNRPIREYLQKIYNIKGRTDDFRKLGKSLVVVAADLDSGAAVRFGEPPFEHVPISLAVAASSALPGLYPPVDIDGRHYVDGVLLKTLHASVALDRGADLVLCINPIVPVDTVNSVEKGFMRRGKLLDRGLPTVLSQTFRTMIHSRLEVGIASYETKFKDADVILLEPHREDYMMFFTNIFSFSERQAVCEHAYEATRRDLLARYDKLAPMFARHGLTLRRDVLEQKRNLWEQVRRPALRKTARSRLEVVRQLDDVLDRLERLVAEKREAVAPTPTPPPEIL